MDTFRPLHPARPAPASPRLLSARESGRPRLAASSDGVGGPRSDRCPRAFAICRNTTRIEVGRPVSRSVRCHATRHLGVGWSKRTELEPDAFYSPPVSTSTVILPTDHIPRSSRYSITPGSILVILMKVANSSRSSCMRGSLLRPACRGPETPGRCATKPAGRNTFQSGRAECAGAGAGAAESQSDDSCRGNPGRIP